MRRPPRSVLRAGGRVVVLAVAALLVHLATSLWLVYRAGASDEARPVDAIVVMGAAQYDGRPAPVLTARLDQAVSLWNRGLAPLVVTTGGKRPGDRHTEAEAEAAYLVEHGVPAVAIVQVPGATSYDELVAARDALEARSAGEPVRVLLVSDPYHSLRIELVAEELGLTAYVSPTRTSPITGWDALAMHLKEASGVAIGRIIGFDRLLSITG